MKNKLFLLVGLCFFALVAMSLRPVPIIEESEAESISGVVEHIYEAGIKDAVFVIRDAESRFYINRGFERGLNLNDLKTNLIGKEVTLKYPKYWTPLDWGRTSIHASKLEHEGVVLFNEFKQ